MAGTKRLIRSFYRLLLPIFVLAVAAIAAASVWLVHETSAPLTKVYLVTPEKYGQLSARGAKITEETWPNQDGTTSRGWLLRGEPNHPAVILLHRYGADRSHVLNLGVKLNEATNFSILMPDLRGHGQDPLVPDSSFGGCEANDLISAAGYLRSLKSPEQVPLVNGNIGVFGIELGALTAMFAAEKEPSLKALVLDSIPRDSDALLEFAISRRYPFASSVSAKFAALGTHAYFYNGCYRRVPACEVAKDIAERRTLLLAGIDTPQFQESTSRTAKCFPSNTTVDSKTDLSPSGMGMTNASLDLSEAYDQRVIDFLKLALTLP